MSHSELGHRWHLAKTLLTTLQISTHWFLVMTLDYWLTIRYSLFPATPRSCLSIPSKVTLKPDISCGHFFLAMKSILLDKKFLQNIFGLSLKTKFRWHFSCQGSFNFVFVMPSWRHRDHTCMSGRRIFIHLWKQKSQGISGIISTPKTLPPLGSRKSQNIRYNWRPSYECKGFVCLFW